MKITKRTVRRLRAAASRFFPDDEAYHTWLGHDYRVDSTLDLSEDQGRAAIADIDRMAKAARKREFGKRGALMITFAQKEYIEGLFEELGIPKGKRRLGFIKKQVGHAKVPDWLTNREASRVITGLERFKESQYNEKHLTSKE